MKAEEMNDHDLLIELRTEMRAVRVDIKDIKDGTTARISALEQEKADKVEVKRVEDELLKAIEKTVRVADFTPVKNAVYGCIALICTTVVGAALLFFFKH